MDAQVFQKFVEFWPYCQTCKHKDIEEDEDGIMPDPCNECLTTPVNENSHKPIRYTEDK